GHAGGGGQLRFLGVEILGETDALVRGTPPTFAAGAEVGILRDEAVGVELAQMVAGRGRGDAERLGDRLTGQGTPDLEEHENLPSQGVCHATQGACVQGRGILERVVGGLGIVLRTHSIRVNTQDSFANTPWPTNLGQGVLAWTRAGGRVAGSPQEVRSVTSDPGAVLECTGSPWTS